MSKSRDYILTIPSFYKPTFSRHPAYSQWASMLTRCRNPNFRSYKNYGARGIKVCKRWELGKGKMSGFECFMFDMGNKPSRAHSLDRIDNNGDYCKENCRWATSSEQANNRRSIHAISYKGETLSMFDMAKKHGVDYFMLRSRMNDNWGIEEAMTKPKGSRRDGRAFAKGPQLPQTKITEGIVRTIRSEYATGKFTMKQIAKKFGICNANVCLIVNRKSWTHVL